MKRETHPRRAFTLAEMLVVIAIICILLAALMASIGNRRISDHRMKCQNNLKQLALALNAYEAIHLAFPPGEVHGTFEDSSYSLYGTGNSNHCNWDHRIGMWLNAIYPRLELDNYYRNLNFTASPQYSDVNNQQEMKRFFDLFHCPADPLRDHLTTAWGPGGENSNPKNQACMLNYFAVGGSELGSDEPHPDNNKANQDRLCNVTNGMFYNDSKVRVADIRDGSSHTAMLAETWGRIFPDHLPNKVSYSPGYPSTERSRGMNGQAYVFFDYPPNADDPRIGSAVHKIPEAKRGSPNRVKSFHTGGAHIACADGSVHFVSESVQYKVNIADGKYDPGVWQFLATINNQDVINPQHLKWK